MKHLKLFIILLVLGFVVKAQAPAPGSYITNNTMTAFHGTWMWTGGNDTVKIVLTTKKVFMTGHNYYIDLLVGWHLYKKGSTIVESSLDQVNNTAGRTIWLMNQNQPNDLKVTGEITDLSKGSKRNDLYLTLNAAQNNITWHCTEPPGRMFARSEDIPLPGVTLPRDIVLIKQ